MNRGAAREVTFFLAEGVVSRYFRSLGSDWRDGAGGPTDDVVPPDGDARSELPLARAATAAEPIDMPPGDEAAP